MVKEASLNNLRKFQTGNKLGGRKPLGIELKAREFILQCIGGEEGVKKIIKSAFGKAIRGSIKHQEFLMNYILGKPVDRIKIENAYGSNAPITSPIVKIIADNLRLEKLSKDIEAAPPKPVDQTRIDEMESILNKAVNEPPLEPLEEIPAANNVVNAAIDQVKKAGYRPNKVKQLKASAKKRTNGKAKSNKR